MRIRRQNEREREREREKQEKYWSNKNMIEREIYIYTTHFFKQYV